MVSSLSSSVLRLSHLLHGLVCIIKKEIFGTAARPMKVSSDDIDDISTWQHSGSGMLLKKSHGTIVSWQLTYFGVIINFNFSKFFNSLKTLRMRILLGQ